MKNKNKMKLKINEMNNTKCKTNHRFSRSTLRTVENFFGNSFSIFLKRKFEGKNTETKNKFLKKIV